MCGRWGETPHWSQDCRMHSHHCTVSSKSYLINIIYDVISRVYSPIPPSELFHLVRNDGLK